MVQNDERKGGQGGTLIHGRFCSSFSGSLNLSKNDLGQRMSPRRVWVDVWSHQSYPVLAALASHFQTFRPWSSASCALVEALFWAATSLNGSCHNLRVSETQQSISPGFRRGWWIWGYLRQTWEALRFDQCGAGFSICVLTALQASLQVCAGENLWGYHGSFMVHYWSPHWLGILESR